MAGSTRFIFELHLNIFAKTVTRNLSIPVHQTSNIKSQQLQTHGSMVQTRPKHKMFFSVFRHVLVDLSRS